MSTRHTRRTALVVSVAVAIAAGAWALQWAAPVATGLWSSSLTGQAPSFSAASLPSSPATGQVTSHLDGDDVYSVDLAKGEAFTAYLTSPGSASFALGLYGPQATSLLQTSDVVAGWESDIYPGFVRTATGGVFTAPEAGTYYLRVFELRRHGGYRIDWAKGALPSLTIGASRSTVSYGGSARIYGTLRGVDSTPVAGETVELWTARYPERYFTHLIDTATTTPEGAYSFTVRPSLRTRFRVVSKGTVPGYAMARTGSKTVVPRVSLGRPTVSDKPKYRNRSFYVWGSLKPLHTAGNKTVRIRCYQKRSDGRYVLRKTVSARNYDYFGYTRYKVKLSLPARGTWKLVAYAPEDGRHAATTSSTRYVRVR